MWLYFFIPATKAISEILKAIENIENKTCMKFVKRTNEPNYVRFTKGRGLVVVYWLSSILANFQYFYFVYFCLLFTLLYLIRLLIFVDFYWFLLIFIDLLILTTFFRCSSFVGNIRRGAQEVSIGEFCIDMSVIAHEILHALGFIHEHTRLDRDQYIFINYTNILTGKYLRRIWGWLTISQLSQDDHTKP